MVDFHQYGSMAFLPYIIITWLIMYCNIVVVDGVLFFTYILLHNNFDPIISIGEPV